jgi:GntR family trehalose operon transcriptional repressor
MYSLSREAAMSRMPDYQRIVNDIKAAIDSGALLPDDRLPSIRQLQHAYGVSEQPVRTALVILRTERRTEGHQGRGIFVRRS